MFRIHKGWGKYLGAACLVLLAAPSVQGQAKPQLVELNFLGIGANKQANLEETVTVELKFDMAMDTTVNPVVRAGLMPPFTLNIPAVGQGWTSTRVWQGFFTVSNNIPETDDGEYIFQIFGALGGNNVKMDTLLSTDLDPPRTLFICRTGQVNLSTTVLDFGSIFAGASKTENFTLFNESCADLVVSNVTVPSPFQLINTPPGFTVPGNSSRELTVLFNPTTRADFDVNLTIFSNDRKQATHTIGLQGSAHGAKILTSPSSALDFGKVEVGFSVTRTLLVINEPANPPQLSDTLQVNNVFTNAAVYTVSRTTLTVAPGDTERLEVTFTPAESRVYHDFILTISSNDFTQPVKTLFLNGDANDETPPGAVSDFTVNIEGFDGFVTGASLPVCWDNPDDVSGIAEIWWKFSRTPTPPASAADTTQFGGRIILAPDATCANLRLTGLPTGFWYCYVWLVDGRGNSGYQNYVSVTFTYDITAPPAPAILARSVPVSHWFKTGTPFRLTVELPEDPDRGSRDAATVRWKFRAPPEDGDDYDGQADIDAAGEQSFSLTVPFDSPELCGDDSLYLWLVDSLGNVDVQNVTAVRYRFDICAPEIRRLAPDDRNIADLGETFRDTVTVSDEVPIDTVWVRYRFGGAGAEEPPRTTTRIPGSNRYVVDIPEAGVTRRGIEYRVIAADSLGNEGFGPAELSLCDTDSLWFPVRTRVLSDFRIDSDGRAVPLLSGTDQTNYQLFSVPYDLDSSAVMDVLLDDLGPYDKTVWRFFDYKPDNPENTRFLEGQAARPFIPGRAYFIITNRDNIVVDSGPGVTRRTVCDDTIRVFEGWNLIATPFNFPVEKASLSLVNAAPSSVVTLRSYERGWNITDVMEPWRGYALFVVKPQGQPSDVPIYLVVHPKAASGRLSKAAGEQPALGPGEWAVQIAAEEGNLHDRDNWAGVRRGAQPAFDALELAEPPLIGTYLQVSFSHPEWGLPAADFSTDFRPLDSGEQVWTFRVRSNRPRAEVRLSFDLLGDLPDGFEVFLVDEALRVSQDLRTAPHYTLRTGKRGLERSLKLIVGSREFAGEQAGAVGLVPERFALLQNYPNPFNPETTIRYDLSRDSDVTVEVFDLLGRRVRSLVRGEKQRAGFHSVSWNGKDDFGRQVASGVYLYRVTAQGRSLVRKMILLK